MTSIEEANRQLGKYEAFICMNSALYKRTLFPPPLKYKLMTDEQQIDSLSDLALSHFTKEILPSVSLDCFNKFTDADVPVDLLTRVASIYAQSKGTYLLTQMWTGARTPEECLYCLFNTPASEALAEIVLKVILKNGVNFNESIGDYTFVQLAAMDKRSKLLQILLEAGADPEHVSSDDESPLKCAIRSQIPKNIELIYKSVYPMRNALAESVNSLNFIALKTVCLLIYIVFASK